MSARIIPAKELKVLRKAQAVLNDAKKALKDAQAEGAQQAETLLEEARLRALQDSARSASKVIMQAEAAAETQMKSLEPALARMVAQTVAQVIGDMDQAKVTKKAVAQALTRLKDHRRARIRTAPDVAEAVRAAVAETDGSGAEVIDIKVDPALEPGRTVLSSDRGFVEIGLTELIAEANSVWEQDDTEGAA